MSRLYNEEWQRRKSMLVRSLFCDIPVLSPVPEESFESDLIQPNDPSEAPYRPYSPLPQLIIEKEPNRHDHPEEYYIKLLKKIKRIYRKLFIENQSLDSDDFNVTNSINEDFARNYESDVEMNAKDIDNDSLSIDSHITINSESYVADFESSDESVDNNSDMNVEESNNLIVDQEESNDEQMDEENDTESSNSENINQESSNMSNDNEMIEARKSNEKPSNDSNSESQDKTTNTDVNNQEMDISEVNKTYEHIHTEENINNSGIDEEMVDVRDDFNIEKDLIREESANAKESEVIASNYDDQTRADEGMDVCDDEADDTLNAGIDYRQITTVAMVHVDGVQQSEGRVSPVYEAVTSPILPPGVVIREDKRDETVLEEQRDPEQILPFSDHDNTIEGIEEMRTPRTKLSIQSNPLTRCSSNKETPNREMSTAPEFETTNHLLEPNISNDINDILTSIINDSNKEISLNKNGRKRKLYEDISVQTIRQVSWDDVRDNFFVGPPKIFRLCRCVDHDCSKSF